MFFIIYLHAGLAIEHVVSTATYHKKISVFSHSFVKFRPYFFIFFPAKSTPPKKNTKKSTACFVDMTYLTPPQQHEKRTDEVLILRLAELADLEELEPGGWSWLIPPTFGESSLVTFLNHLGIDSVIKINLHITYYLSFSETICNE